MKNKILTSIGACIIVFAMGAAAKTHAAATDNVTGFIWGGADNGTTSSGLGWVSMNSLNCDTDNNGKIDSGACGSDNSSTNVVDYGVNIPASGTVAGYAWSPNMGYIDFAPQSHCGSAYAAASCVDPDGGNGGITRTGGNLTGWARIVDIAAASATGNSGGNSGWIHMNGSTYSVVIDGAGKLGGYAWSDEYGALHFSGTDYGAEIPGPPTITLNLPIMINVKTTTLPQTETLTWSSTDAGSCDVSSTPNNVWTQNGIGISGTHAVNVAGAMNETFSFTCHGFGGQPDANAVTKIATVCYPQGCAAQVCDDNMADTINTKWGVTDTSTCSPMPPSTCSNNDDCTSRSSGKWIEVAP